MTKHLKKSLRTAARGLPKHDPKGLWSAERRARQAEVIRASQPWKKSTGPQTSSGKARSAANALKHGFRSRAFIERVRQERQLIHDAASTIALAKLVLGPRGACPPAAWSLSSGRAEPVLRPRFARTGGRGPGGARSRGPSCGLWTAEQLPYGRRIPRTRRTSYLPPLDTDGLAPRTPARELGTEQAFRERLCGSISPFGCPLPGTRPLE